MIRYLRYCSECGHRLSDGSSFCLKCQRLLDDSQIDALPLGRLRAAGSGAEQGKKKKSGYALPLAVAMGIAYTAIDALNRLENKTALVAALITAVFLLVTFGPALFSRKGERSTPDSGRTEFPDSPSPT